VLARELTRLEARRVLASAVVDAVVVDKIERCLRPDRPPTTGAQLPRYSLAMCFVPAPLRLAPCQPLRFGARALSIEFPMCRAFFIKIAIHRDGVTAFEVTRVTGVTSLVNIAVFR